MSSIDSGSYLRPAGPQPLTFIRKFSYGVGHVLNDLCASMWFTYLLIFYHQVLGVDNIMAGNLLLIGQVADALATPFVGYESDRLNGFCGYGKRKSWHLLALLMWTQLTTHDHDSSSCICVGASFAFIFMPVIGTDAECYSLDSGSSYTTMIYYAPFIVIFQFGWAATQISHLSLIPSLSNCEHDKVGLNSIRYAFTVISNITVYVIAWLLLTLSIQNSNTEVTPKDFRIFRTLAFIVIGTGGLFSIIFHVGTKEDNSNEELSHTLSTSVRRRMGVLCWFKTPQFYIVGLLYMCTRLIVNLSQVYLGMYLTETLSLTKTYIAIVPLVVYVTGFLATFPIKAVSKKLGKKKVYTFGLTIVIGASIWYRFLTGEGVDEYLVMVAAGLAGAGGSTILVLSLSITADLIDQNTESAAFVYGAMSFTDKLSNGVAVQIIQILHPCKASACCEACSPFYRNIMTFVPMGFCVLAFVTLLLIKRRNTEYMLLVNNEGDATKALTDHRPNGYGALDNHTPSNNTPVMNHDSDSDEAAETTSPHSINNDNTNGSSYHNSLRVKPSFVVGSTPTPDSPGTLRSLRN